MDDDPPPPRHETDDIVARDGRTAPREGDEQPRSPLYGDGAPIVFFAEGPDLDGLRRLFAEVIEEFEEDLRRRDGAVADRGKHLILRIEGEFFGDLFEALGGSDLGDLTGGDGDEDRHLLHQRQIR